MTQFNPPKQNLFEVLRYGRDKSFGSNRLFPLQSPESRLKSQFIDTLDEDTDVMAKHLAQNLVDLSSRSLSPNRTAKLSLYHGEGSLHIRPLVVMLQEGSPIEIVEVPHPIPETVKLVVIIPHASGIYLEGNKCRSTLSLNSPQIPSVGIGFIGGDLIDIKSLGSPANQSGKLQVVSRLKRSSLYTGDDMGFDTTNQMRLYPSLLTAFLTILVVKPSGISSRSEARGVNGEVGLYCPERAGTLLNKSLEQGCQIDVLQIAEGASERRGLRDQSFSFRFPKVGHEASAGHCSVDLAGNPEYHISQWQSWSPKLVFWLGYAVAEVSEQGNKPLLFVGLSLIVGRPFLRASHFNRLGVGGAAVGLGLPLDYELYRMNVFARQVASLKIGAGAKRLAVVKVYDIASVAGLGRDFPAQLVFLNLACVCYYQPSLFSCVHLNTPSLYSLFYAYYTILSMVLSIPFWLNCPIDKAVPSMVYYVQVDDVLALLADLKEKGWGNTSIANEIGVTVNAVEKWQAGERNIRPSHLILLNQLLKKKPPKKRHYAKSSRRQEVTSNG